MLLHTVQEILVRESAPRREANRVPNNDYWLADLVIKKGFRYAGYLAASAEPDEYQSPFSLTVGALTMQRRLGTSRTCQYVHSIT